MNANQQASAKQQNKPQTKPKGDCNSSTLTKINTLNLKSKEKNENQWRLKLTSIKSYDDIEEC